MKINVKDIGAKGDGVSNDYPYFVKARDIINRNGSGELIIPPGVYYFDYYIDADTLQTSYDLNDEKCIDFRQCSYVKITGYNAQLIMKGDFHRKAHWSAQSGNQTFFVN